MRTSFEITLYSEKSNNTLDQMYMECALERRMNTHNLHPNERADTHCVCDDVWSLVIQFVGRPSLPNCDISLLRIT